MAAPSAATHTAAAGAQTATAAAPAPAPAATRPSLLSRLLGLLPLGTGIAQAVVGFMITRGTLAIAGLPLIGALPGWLVGTLVAATSITSILGGIQRLLGRA